MLIRLLQPHDRQAQRPTVGRDRSANSLATRHSAHRFCRGHRRRSHSRSVLGPSEDPVPRTARGHGLARNAASYRPARATLIVSSRGAGRRLRAEPVYLLLLEIALGLLGAFQFSDEEAQKSDAQDQSVDSKPNKDSNNRYKNDVRNAEEFYGCHRTRIQWGSLVAS